MLVCGAQKKLGYNFHQPKKPLTPRCILAPPNCRAPFNFSGRAAHVQNLMTLSKGAFTKALMLGQLSTSTGILKTVRMICACCYALALTPLYPSFSACGFSKQHYLTSICSGTDCLSRRCAPFHFQIDHGFFLRVKQLVKHFALRRHWPRSLNRNLRGFRAARTVEARLRPQISRQNGRESRVSRSCLGFPLVKQAPSHTV